MNNFDLYNLLNFIVNKDVYAQAIRPQDFDLELKAKNIRHLRKRIGLPETYIPGSANEGVGVTRIGDKDLLPFLVEEDLAPVNQVIELNSNWYYILDWYTTASITSDLVGIEEVSNRIRNYITAPTATHPCAYIVPSGLKVYPADLTAAVTVIYYRQPATPVFQIKDTTATSLEVEYDEDNSVELEWDDGNKLDILYMILQDMGLNIERQDVVQIAAKLIQQGK